MCRVAGIYNKDLKFHTVEVTKLRIKNACKKCGEGCNLNSNLEEYGEIVCDVLIDKFYKNKN